MKTLHAEYVLIGSGVAAVTLAERLLQADPLTPIVILEAGNIFPAKDRRAWWDYVTSGKAVYSPGQDLKEEYSVKSNVDWDCEDNRLIAYGGSTLHWGGWSLRLKPEDFHLKENTGQGADWPFGYATLHDYYYEAEHRLAVCGNHEESWNHKRLNQPYPLPPFEWTEADGEMIGAFRKLGIEPGRMPLARFRKCMATGTCKYCPVGARYTAQNALDELRCGPYPFLTVRELCPVTRILMKSKDTAEGVEYLDRGGDLQPVLAEHVIVCAGAYESPKLLLQSHNTDWPHGIGNQHRLVGRFLVSHSILRVRGVRMKNPECWIQEYDFPTLMSRTYDTPEFQRHGKLFLFKNRKFPHLNFAESMIKGRNKTEIEKALQASRIMELQAFLEEKGRYENHVTLGSGQTRWKLPTTHVEFNRTEAEMASADSRLEILKRVIHEMGYKVTESQVDRPGGHHATGTCRMAISPESGVTDPNLLVHGTTNLFVCSNAVFPTGSAVNPTLTLTALSLRLGDHLLTRKGKSPRQITDASPGTQTPTSKESQ